MDVTVLNRQRGARVNARALRDLAEKLAALHPPERAERMAICLVSDRAMAGYNGRYRGKNRTTDVLAFPCGDDADPEGSRHLGDIVISAPRAAAQARERGHSLARELAILLVHAYLHLLGHDHETDRGQMLRLQKRLVARLLPLAEEGGGVMTGWSAGLVAATFAAAGVLFLVDLGLSTALLAINSLSRVAVRRLSQESGGRLGILEELKATQSSCRMAVQVGRQMCLLGGSVLTGLAARGAGSPHPWLLGVFCGTVLGVLLLETLAARALAQHDPRSALRVLALLVRVAQATIGLVVAPLATLTRGKPASAEHENGEKDDGQEEEELEALIEVGERDGILEADEGEMVRSIVDLGDTRIREIMTPRTDIVAFPASATVADVRRALVVGVAHSRYPVFTERIDNVVGVLHVRDLLRAWEEQRPEAPLTAYVRPAFFVPETRTVAELLAEMRQRTHMALVVDEYGGIAGLVTLEDLLEEIVGDIRDEHDVEEALVQQEGDGWWLVNGLAHVEELENLFDLEVGEREYDTVGGLVVAAAGRVPAEREVLEAHGLKIQVVRADRKRVYKVRLRRASEAGGVGATP